MENEDIVEPRIEEENNAQSDTGADVATSEEEQESSNSSVTERPEIGEEDLPKLIEALLFVAGTPLSINKLINIVKFSEESVIAALATIRSGLDERGAPVELLEVNDGWQFRTKEIFAPFIQDLKRSKPKRLSPAALETLAVIAYRQPVVKSDIEAIRGVDVTPTLKTLLDRKLIRIIGYQATVGQPALYGTTELFLELFGLKSIADLPSLRDLKEINDDPGEGGLEGDGNQTLESSDRRDEAFADQESEEADSRLAGNE